MTLSPEQVLIAEAVGLVPLNDEEKLEPFPADSFIPKSLLRPSTPEDEAPRVGWPMLRWRGGWWAVPTMEDIEEWTFDSVCFTPDDDEVEPDHPDSWLRILGLI